MNILEALEVALPELPARSAQQRYPKLDPRVIAREHVEREGRVVLAKVPGSNVYLRFAPEQWKLLQLFDGERSYRQIAEASAEQTGVAYSEEDVKEFASYLEADGDLFYKTPLEKNVILKQKLSGERQKRKRLHIADVTDITLHRWPNADVYLSKLQPHLEFIYTGWFTALTLLVFGVMFWMWADKFGEIWADSFAFYNFTQKSGRDLVEFWFLFGTLAFCHESAHGLTCKHFGAHVEKMEFLLMYFAPTFVCDVTQVWIVGDSRARLLTVAAGIWGDLMICAAATAVWWGTATGMFVHDFAYKVMMVTGIGVTILNLNPLIKLDGYYMLSELLGEADLKERATTYVSQWTRLHIFRLPAELEYVPRRRRVLYFVYALLSGVYSYGLIILVLLFAYHVLRSFFPDWAWLPAWVLAYWMFKSRIRILRRFMTTLYLDKKERVKAWLTPGRMAALGLAGALLLFAPIWPDFVSGPFVLESGHRAVVRAQVPGEVVQVLASEGQQVSAGVPLLRLRNLQLESAATQAAADLKLASARAIDANLNYGDFGAAEHERQELLQRQQSLAQQVAELQVASPDAGVVATPRLHDLLGKYLTAGATVAEVADLSTMTARIFVPEFGVRDLRLGERVRLQPRSAVLPINGKLRWVGPASSPVEPGFVQKEQLEGLHPPHYYVAKVDVANHGELREGMTGTAKIFVRRRSLAAFAGRFARDLVERRVW